MGEIPGIVEVVAGGRGLGSRFLRHIERNAVLLFMVPADSRDIRDEYAILTGELEKFNPELLFKPRIIAVTKADMLDEALRAGLEKELHEGLPTIFISSVTGQGI